MFKRSKKEIYREVVKILFVIFGNILLAFGTAIFLTNLNIVAGGLSGIGIILQYWFTEWFGEGILGGQFIDIVVFILTWILWVVGLIVLGKSFALKTLIAAIVYPLALSLFLRVDAFVELSEVICYYGMSVEEIESGVAPIGNILICGLFGGVFIGSGVALSFVGGGSTGGLDVIIAIIDKYTPIKSSVASFALDFIVILVGMFAIPNNIMPALCGIIAAFVTAMMIEYIYIGNQTAYQVDIISDKWEEISEYVQDKLERGATIIHANGGYQGENRIILRIVIDKSQYIALKDFIAICDPKAFVTFTQTNAVYGEGFKTNTTLRKNKIEKEEETIE